MKPPGGECHDLFGASFSGTPSHLRVLKPPGGGSSDIFGVSGGEQTTSEPRRNKIHQSSNLFLGDDDASSTTSSKASNKPDGNPVTGEGYDMPLSKPQTPNQQLTNGGSTSSVPNASSNNSAQTPAASAPSRQRVPPGGFSSGLW
ncbi:uncharacterized protein LOC142327296 isoform X1 [Lycorma delicatula]|uniref:uncharacterized protein LOC142327296 isoform X1 n=1 Tax=Lycorma delicatula TaxID=130591 RepID=UPI003F5115D6